METTFEEFILQQIGEKNPMHLKKIRRNLKRIKLDADFEGLAKSFYDKYDAYLLRIGKTRQHAVDSYLRMIDDFTTESVEFEKTGKYSSSSFAEVNERVYANPEVMEYYMHGLLLTQFIWAHHYELLNYYSAKLKEITAGNKTYLEIGGGHGLYLNIAKQLLRGEWNFSVVDISATSLEIARNFVEGEGVKFIHADVNKLDTEVQADLLVMGEVLEHLENPKELLVKLQSRLKNDGTLFITTPTNAPAIDHIYLFRNRTEIRVLIDEAGYNITDEKSFSSEDIPVDDAERMNIPILYSAFLRKK
jgi:2-polyprenyl-3-methyl-5-hydroxy-6-metoxy-1,4-benzoquinol methylase